MQDAVAGKVEEIVERAGRAEGIEAVEVRWLGAGNSRVLRIYIDKPGGVTHGDCEKISEAVSAVLDAEDIVEGGAYTLEVSSPGVERRLTRPKDFERFTGQKIKVVLREPVGGKKLLEGVLAKFAGGVITLKPERGEAVEIPLEKVTRANLKFEW
jgi:ribosome maturation factor RimP